MFNIKRKRKEDDLTYLERVYSKILKKDPNSFLYLPLASIFYHKGNTEKAIKTLQKSLSVHSSYATAKYYLGFLYRENGEVDKAAEMFKEVAFASKGHYAAHKALAQYYLDKKDEKNSLIKLKELNRLVPSNVFVHDQINRLEQKLKEDKGTLASAKKDGEKTRKKKNVSKMVTPQLKKQIEEKDDRLGGSDRTISSLENWLKNIDRIFEKA